VTYSLGTTETLVCPLERFLAALRKEGYPCYPHVVRDRFVTLAGNFTGGILLQWFRDTFAEQEVRDAQATRRDVYDLLVEEMADTSTDVLVLPHFTTTGPPWNDPDSAGAIVGLHLSTTKGEFIRALLEGVTFEIGLNMRHLALFGVSTDYCRVVGGGAKARKVVQLKADILGKSLVVGHDRDASCRGAALLAAEGARLVPDAAAAAGDWQHGLHEIRPREGAMRWYAGRFEVYQHLYPAVKALLQTREEGGV
jgi:xylulokinase